MKGKNVKVLISRVLLFALFSVPFLMIGPIDEANAWLMHQTNCKTIYEAKVETGVEYGPAGKKVKASASAGVRIECDTEFHWNPLPHGSDSSSGSCDSGSSAGFQRCNTCRASYSYYDAHTCPPY